MFWVLAWILCVIATIVLGVSAYVFLIYAFEQEMVSKAIVGIVLVFLTAISAWGIWALYISGASTYLS